MAVEIFPTAVPVDESQLRERANFVRGFSKNFHIDADDGIFTPLTCWPYIAKGRYQDFDLLAAEGLETEVHLMVQDPREIGRRFAEAGARAVFGHVETFANVEDAKETLGSWRALGAKEVGMAILLDTPLRVLDDMVQFCDFLCLMGSAQIGAQGAKFDPNVIERAREVHKRFPVLQLEVDIGVSEDTIHDLALAGVTRFAVGSALARSENPANTHAQLLSLAQL